MSNDFERVKGIVKNLKKMYQYKWEESYLRIKNAERKVVDEQDKVDDVQSKYNEAHDNMKNAENENKEYNEKKKQLRIE